MVFVGYFSNSQISKEQKNSEKSEKGYEQASVEVGCSFSMLFYTEQGNVNVH